MGQGPRPEERRASLILAFKELREQLGRQKNRKGFYKNVDVVSADYRDGCSAMGHLLLLGRQ